MINRQRKGAVILKRGEQGLEPFKYGHNLNPAGTCERRTPPSRSRLIDHSTLRMLSLPISLILLLFIPGPLFGQDGSSIFSQVFEGQSGAAQVAGWVGQATVMTLRLALAAVLAAMLAFRRTRLYPRPAVILM